MGYHDFIRNTIKKQDSPWDADLTGSVASTVGAKITRFSIVVNTSRQMTSKNLANVDLHSNSFTHLGKSGFDHLRFILLAFSSELVCFFQSKPAVSAWLPPAVLCSLPKNAASSGEVIYPPLPSW